MDILFVDMLDFKNDEAIPMPSIGVSILATILLKAGRSVEIFNFAYEKREGKINLDDDYELFSNSLVDLILSYHAKIIGFTTMCDTYPFVIDISRKIRDKNKDTRLILGGSHASLVAHQTIEAFTHIDLIAIGESEGNIVNIVDALLCEDSGAENELGVIPNLVYRHSGRIHTTPLCDRPYDTNLIPMIDDEIIQKFINKGTQSFSIDAGRGCPFACTFCCTSDFWGHKFRTKPVVKLIAEIKHMNQAYGVKEFQLLHDLFTANKEKLYEFCNAVIDENLDIEWACSARIDTIDEETIQLMAKAKCGAVFLGIETGSKRMQKRINKNYDIDAVLPIIKLLKKHMLKVTVSFIYGFPDETIADLSETLLLIQKIISLGVHNIQLHKLKLFPNTDELKKAYGGMYFNESGINCHFFESRYLGDMAELIASNRDLFGNFYEFSGETRDSKWQHLHTFILALMLKFKFFKYIYEALFATHRDIVAAYLHYSRTIEDEMKHISSDDARLNLEEEYHRKVKAVTIQILNKFVSETNDYVQQVMLDFGSDVLDFCEDKESKVTVKEYPFDVITFHRQGLSAAQTYKNKATAVRFAKDDKNRCYYMRVKSEKSASNH